MAESGHTQGTPSKTLVLNFNQVRPMPWGGDGLAEVGDWTPGGADIEESEVPP